MQCSKILLQHKLLEAETSGSDATSILAIAFPERPQKIAYAIRLSLLRTIASLPVTLYRIRSIPDA